MKKAIITPTFKPHFKFVEKYLDSALKYVLDPENVKFFFTVSDGEVVELSKRLEKYKHQLDIEILSFDKILKYYNVPYADKKLLSKYGKFSYQTLKKFYTMLYIDLEQMLILDSESMFIRDTNVEELFSGFFLQPFITACELDYLPYTGFFKSKVMENIELTLNPRDVKKEKTRNKEDNYSKPSLSNIWFLENFVWFYDRKILNDLFNEFGSPIEIIERIYRDSNREQGCFEICLYQGYIYQRHETYNYQVFYAKDILENIFKNNEKLYQKYEKEYYSLWHGEFGILEMAMCLLNNDNSDLFAKEFKARRFNIIRCDFTNLKNYHNQARFLEKLAPNILAASQNHTWGINDNTKDKLWNLLVFNNIFARFIYADLKGLMMPFRPLYLWMKRFYFLGKHSVLWLSGVISNFSIFRK